MKLIATIFAVSIAIWFIPIGYLFALIWGGLMAGWNLAEDQARSWRK
jgi:hypothetical protein